VTIGTLEEVYCEVLPHPAYSTDMALSDPHPFRPIIEGLRGKRFIANNEIKLSVQQWLDVQQQTFFGRDIMKLPK
jgi:hypothetical protein